MRVRHTGRHDQRRRSGDWGLVVSADTHTHTYMYRVVVEIGGLGVGEIRVTFTSVVSVVVATESSRSWNERSAEVNGADACACSSSCERDACERIRAA